MKVFVTGGTGFVGSEVIRQLVAADHEVIALVRPGSEDKLVKPKQVTLHHGDVNDLNSLIEGMQQCEAVIHLVGIIREDPKRQLTFERLHVDATRNVIQAATVAGARRLIHMSANGARPDSNTAYHDTKWRGEELVRSSKLQWTIIRPNLIFGPGGEFVEMLADLIRKLPVVPVVGDGQYRMQPVAVEQVAETYVKALSLDKAAGNSYELGGAASYSYDEILDLTGQALGQKKVIKLHQPVMLVKPVVSMLEGFSKFPITSDQLTMMLEGNECDEKLWADDFKIDPTTYADGIGACFGKQA
jgi:NADH dehydrogenase